MKNILLMLLTKRNRQFFYYWGVLMDGGLLPTKAMEMAAKMTGSRRINRLAAQTLAEIKNGYNWTEAMTTTGGFSDLEISTIAVHEIAGSLEKGALRLGR